MDTTAASIARRAAVRLAPDTDPQLPEQVERHLLDAPPPDTYEPIALSIATLVVSVASLAWTIYTDSKQGGKPPRRDAVRRRVRVELAERSAADPGLRDRIVEIVLDETFHDHDNS